MMAKIICRQQLKQLHELSYRRNAVKSYQRSIFERKTFCKNITANFCTVEQKRNLRQMTTRRHRVRMKGLKKSKSKSRFHMPDILHMPNAATVENLEQSISSLRVKMLDLDRNFKYRGFHALRWIIGAGFLTYFVLYIFRREIKEEIGSTGAEITSMTLSDTEVLNKAKLFLKKLMNDEENIEVFVAFLVVIGQNERFQKAVGNLFGNVLQQQYVKDQVKASAIYGAHQTLNDQNVYQHLVQSAASCLSLPEVHEPAANEFLNQLKLAMIPGIFKSVDKPSNTVKESASEEPKTSSAEKKKNEKL